MSGLLQRARSFRDRIGKKIASRQSNDLAGEINREKEDEVMAEMNAILENNRIQITDETLSFKAQSSGAFFPVLINLTAILVLVGLGGLFIWMFDQNEETITRGENSLQSAEGRIIEAVRRASEEEIARKEDEINSIQDRLSAAQASQAALEAETEAEISRREASLRQELSTELEAERERLRSEGLSEEALNQQLADFEARKRDEFEASLAAVSAELEARRAAQETQLNTQIENIRQSLEGARTEQARLEAEMESRLATAREEAAQATEQALSERSAALAELESLGRRQEEQRLVQDQILSIYDQVNRHLSQTEYQEALNQLTTLEDYLGRPTVASIPFVAERRNVDDFLISSLRRLIRSEIGTEPATPGPPPILATVNSLVEEGNQLYENGNREEARDRYLQALNVIPALETGYNRLEALNETTRAENLQQVQAGLAAGSRLYNDQAYPQAIARYREALRLLEIDDASASAMVDQLTDAGYRVRRAREPDPEPIIVEGEISGENRQLIEQAREIAVRQAEFRAGIERLQDQLRLTEVNQEESSREALIALLNTKLLIRQALASDAVRAEYPDLYKQTESVFEAYGEMERRDAKEQTLEEIIDLTSYLGGDNPEGAAPINPTEAAEQRELLLRFLQNLEELVGGDAP